jgi:hypothetical protein
MNSSQKDRLAYREQVARELGVLLDPPLSFRAAKFAAQHKTRADLVKWLKHENTRNCWQMGRKTYVELCMAFGMAVPAKGPTTLGAKLRAVEAKLEKIQAALAESIKENADFIKENTALEDTCLYRAGLTADGVEFDEYERQGIKDYGRFLVEHCLNRVMEVVK